MTILNFLQFLNIACSIAYVILVFMKRGKLEHILLFGFSVVIELVTDTKTDEGEILLQTVVIGLRLLVIISMIFKRN